MPIINGDAPNGGVSGQALRKGPILDHKKALDILQQDYKSRDGLDIDDLLDSKEHGALTYNDFLVLPGYIGRLAHTCSRDASLTPEQASLPQK